MELCGGFLGQIPHTLTVTDAAFRRANPRDKSYKLANEKGLYILIVSR